ncbi:MAG: adenylate/guanylate cyclase domain-containing protein [Acidimicrobiales bacterium]
MTTVDRPKSLDEYVEQLGIAPDEAARARSDNTLGLLILDRLIFPEPGVYTADEVTARSGLAADAGKFWRALGYPSPEPEDRIFSQIDLEMLQLIDAILRLDLLQKEVALQLTRVIGSSMARVAQAQVDAMEPRLDAPPVADPTELAVQRAGMLLPLTPRIMEYAWRRHFQIAARRRMVRDSLAAAGEEAPVCVGFVDLVGFTALSQQLGDMELAAVVDRFETIAYDVVTGHGGRVVKMIGDEVMFEVADPLAGLETALSLSDAYHTDEAIADVRAGLAHGPVLAREGDLFGPTVNLASRIVSIAYPGSVVVSEEVRTAVGDEAPFVWKPLRTRYLKDIGRVHLFNVRRADDEFEREGVLARARRQRGTMRDRVADLVERLAGEGEEE